MSRVIGRPREAAVPVRSEFGAAVVTAHGVSVSLGGTQIVSGVDFTVRAGEMLAIIGPNGAGKSTLLGALAGDHAYGGSIMLDGREVSAWSTRELALRRSVLRQSNTLSFPFNVVDVVKMGRAPWRSITTVAEDDRIIAQELLRSDTFRFAERAFTSLSGGEGARVSLARAMTQRTGVLLLDEPTAALDINYQEQVLAVARHYARQGNGVVVVLHDLAAAAAYADRVLLLAEGGMRAFGTPREVLTAQALSEVYGHPVRVLEDTDGTLMIVPVRFADEAPAPPSVPHDPHHHPDTEETT
ncbi:heme ABC transporter ATP-binding protein [Leucobacter rhizosphaerae]|uniref:Heme ABC transporter ATP-binding protein n=1 Tax=Leucobacter rhizosphaerae TaxID=2932245 RepID=A0ABY4FUG7_9MICO|nr:heme ABC transporter ATP-binding protein [Leucobacter rhizosphaerae]UOQ59881.1 heme ABC transporter ATP-binding protein [Leucobacter rhizosphaerae]